LKIFAFWTVTSFVLGKSVVSETFLQPVFCPEFSELDVSTLLCNILLHLKTWLQ